jgi:hypothetical protein
MLRCFYFHGFSRHLRFVLSVCHCLIWFSFAQIWISCSSHLFCSRSSSRAGLVSAADFWACAAHARVLVLPPVPASGQVLRVGFPFAEHATRSALARFSSACFVPQLATIFSSVHHARPRSRAPSRASTPVRPSVSTLRF